MELPDDFPTNELGFEERFGDEARCREYLMKLRWPDGFRCPKCTANSGWKLKGRELVECASCGRQTSLTAGTVLHGTRKPLRLWFRAMFLMACQKSGLSAKNFMRLMGMKSYKTAWTWLHKLRRAMVRPERPRLEGKVEVDETYAGGPVEGTVGRRHNQPDGRDRGGKGRKRRAKVPRPHPNGGRRRRHAALAPDLCPRECDGWERGRYRRQPSIQRVVAGRLRAPRERSSATTPSPPPASSLAFTASPRWSSGGSSARIRARSPTIISRRSTKIGAQGTQGAFMAIKSR